MVNYDSLGKAPLNDTALSRQQKLYGGSRFTSYTSTFYQVPEHISCQVISLWMQASYGINLLCLFTTHLSPLIVFILKCNTFYMPCWQILHQAQHNPCHPQRANRFQFCRDLNLQYFRVYHQWYGAVILVDMRLKHLVSYKIPCSVNEQGMRGGHQSPANQPPYPLNFSTRMR